MIRKWLFVNVVAAVLLAGCTQTDGRYMLTSGEGETFLLDQETGCVWMYTPGKFLKVEVAGLHEGSIATQKIEGCP